MDNYIVYGKPANPEQQPMNPLHDMKVCECDEIGFAKSVMEAMAEKYNGETYYILLKGTLVAHCQVKKDLYISA